MPKMFQDDQSKIFIPYDNKYESNLVKKLTEEYTNLIVKEKCIDEPKLQKEKYFDEPNLKKLDPEYMVALANIGKDGTFKKYYKDEIERASSTISFLNKKIKEDPTMPSEKINIINQLKELYTSRENYFTNKFNDEPETNKNINIKLIDKSINILLNKLRDQEGSGVFTYQNDFVKLVTLLTQLLTKNNSKKIKDEINQILKKLYNLKQITKQVYNNLIRAITYLKNLTNLTNLT